MHLQGTTKVRTVEVADGLLAEQTLKGDQHAFESLVQRYSTPLFNFIYRFLGDYDQACDVLQHVFIQLHTSLPSLRTDKPLKAWLFQVARNRCLDELRRKHAVNFSELESANDDEELSALAAIPDTSPLPEELAERSDLQDHLQQAIETLPISSAQSSSCAMPASSVSQRLGKPCICRKRPPRPTSSDPSPCCVPPCSIKHNHLRAEKAHR